MGSSPISPGRRRGEEERGGKRGEEGGGR